MARPKPFAIRFRTLIPDAVRRIGVKAFGTKGYFLEYFNSNIFEQAQEHVLGTLTQLNEDDATIYYDDTAGVFKDRLGSTVTLANYDRVAMIVATADQNIDFPVSKEIVFVPYDVVDLDSNTLNLAGTYSGTLQVNNGSVVITGTCNGLVVNGTATVDRTLMVGTVLVNGKLFSSTSRIDSPEINEAVAITATSTELNQLDGISGANVDQSSSQSIDGEKEFSDIRINESVQLTSTSTELNQLDGVSVGGNTSGDILTTNDTQTITDKTLSGDNNAINEVDSVKDQGGVASSGMECKILEIGDWDMSSATGTDFKEVNHGLGASWKKIRSVSVVIRNDTDTSYDLDGPADNTGGSNELWVSDLKSSTIKMIRRIGGKYTTADWNLTSYNRGWITIWYQA